jgi:hypothetical protein
VLVGEDPNAAFHLVAEQDKSHNAPTKLPCSKTVMEIGAPWCPKVDVPSCYFHMLEDAEQLCLETYELPPYAVVYRHETPPFVKQIRSKNEVLKSQPSSQASINTP